MFRILLSPLRLSNYAMYVASLMVVFQSPAVCRDLPLEIGQGRDRLSGIKAKVFQNARFKLFLCTFRALGCL